MAIDSAERTLDAFEHNVEIRGEIMSFDLGVETEQWLNPTIYNPSIEFDYQGKRVMFCRLEEFDDEVSSQIRLFEVNGNHLTLLTDAPVYDNMQDPYYLGEFSDPTRKTGERWKVFGGVRIIPDALLDPKTKKPTEHVDVTLYQDVFFRFRNDLSETLDENGNLEPFATGVEYSKDMRFIQMDGYIAAFPRPQRRTVGGLHVINNGKHERLDGELKPFGAGGNVGFFKAKNVNTLTEETEQYIEKADESTLVKGIFEEGEWGGVNQVIRLTGDIVLLVGHKASRTTSDKGDNEITNLHYRPFTALFDCNKGQIIGKISDIDITPADFDPTPAKRDALEDVIFTAGLMPHEDSFDKCYLIVGKGDAAVGKIEIENPLNHLAVYLPEIPHETLMLLIHKSGNLLAEPAAHRLARTAILKKFESVSR
ncbi:hypothetical protein B7Z28_00915 [Candidatus Saccharibacteria bacterium 32-45-3]|nr:MAG: hypothetical protein B7Z28_00915 [Candidatus Saccharibacteria bacterium 32-45-3]